MIKDNMANGIKWEFYYWDRISFHKSLWDKIRIFPCLINGTRSGYFHVSLMGQNQDIFMFINGIRSGYFHVSLGFKSGYLHVSLMGQMRVLSGLTNGARSDFHALPIRKDQDFFHVFLNGAIMWVSLYMDICNTASKQSIAESNFSRSWFHCIDQLNTAG